MLKIYLISQTENDGYNAFDSAIVIAKDENYAKLIHPFNINKFSPKITWDAHKKHWMDGPFPCDDDLESWCNPEHVKVQEIGIANDQQKEGEVVCVSNK